ncbi:hypothetical protein P9112_002922 [Eukaryota sp. TZLM1-RC]
MQPPTAYSPSEMIESTATTVKFLYGIDGGPKCSLLTIAEYSVLLDCGWSSDLDALIRAAVNTYATKIDAVVISNPDYLHCGALPLLHQQGFSGGVFITQAAAKMAVLNLYALQISLHTYNASAPYSLDAIDEILSLDRVSSLVFGEPSSLTHKSKTLTFTPFRSGMSLGSAIWSISLDGYTITCPRDRNHLLKSLSPPTTTGSMLYAPLWTYRSEKTLTPDDPVCPTPSLIMASGDVSINPLQSKKKRDTTLIESITSVVADEGKVILNSDISGKVFEVISLLNSQWKAIEKAAKRPLCLYLLSPVSHHVVEFAKTMLVDSNPQLQDLMEVDHRNPFDFDYLVAIHSVNDIDDVSGPMIVINSVSDGFDCCSGLGLIADWCRNSKNLIIFTDPKISETGEDQVGTVNWDQLSLAQKFTQKLNNPHEIFPSFSLELWILEPISGEAYNKWKAQKLEEIAEEIRQEQMEMEEQETSFELPGPIFNTKQIDYFGNNLRFKEHLPMSHDFDDFGVLIDLNQLIDYQNKEVSESEHVTSNPRINEELESPPLIPVKKVTSTVINCQLKMIDFSSGMDLRAFVKFINSKDPRSLSLAWSSKVKRQELKNKIADVIADVIVPLNDADDVIVPLSHPSVPVIIPQSEPIFSSIEAPCSFGAIVPNFTIDKASGLVEVLPAPPPPLRRSIFIENSVDPNSRTDIVRIAKKLKTEGIKCKVIHGKCMVGDVEIIKTTSTTDGKAFKVQGKISRKFFRIKKILENVLGKRI